MKKYLFLTALVGASLASCTQEEIDLPKTGGDSELITFASPVVGNMTRVATTNPYEIWNNYPTADKESFAVWAHYYDGTFNGYSNGELYMDEVTVKYKSTDTEKTWAPTTPYYWPKNGTLTFIGYSPASKNSYASISDDGKGIIFTNYVVSTTQEEQIDLLFSERSYNQKKYKENDPTDDTTDNTAGSNDTNEAPTVKDDIYTGAHLVFKHALSSILFNVKTDYDYSSDGTNITLTGITLNNVISKATFNQNLGDYVAGNDLPVTTAPTQNNGTGDNWIPADDSKVNYVAYTNTTGTEGEGALLSTTPFWPSTGTTTAPSTDKTNGKRTTDLILIPQSLNGVTLTLNYTIESPDSKHIAQTNTINLFNDGGQEDWDWGYRYIYNITIGLEDITVEPYVTPWVDFDSNTTTDTKDPIDVNVNDYN